MYSVEKTKSLNFFKQFDYFLFITVALISGIGLIVLSSATKTMLGGQNMLIKQAACLLLGIIAAFVITVVDYKDFKVLGIVLYLISVTLLVYVYFKGTGAQQWGSNSWISFPVIGSFQPSEIAKITFVIVVSIFLERIKEGQNVQKNMLKLAVYATIPIGLVMIQPDFGTAMVFIFILCTMLFVYGMKYKYMLGTIVASIPAGVFAWFFLLNDKRRSRILVFLNPDLDPQGASWQVRYAIRAIGSGQLFGKELYHGLQTQKGTVPVKESDFIFTVIGEELGFIGAVIIIVLIFLLLMRCLYIAKNSRDLFGSFMVTGLTGMMGFHFVQNIGMCIGILPVTGIPLPFISYGGSSMVTNYIAIGIILSISMRRKRTIFNNTQ